MAAGRAAAAVAELGKEGQRALQGKALRVDGARCALRMRRGYAPSQGPSHAMPGHNVQPQGERQFCVGLFRATKPRIIRWAAWAFDETMMMACGTVIVASGCNKLRKNPLQ